MSTLQSILIANFAVSLLSLVGVFFLIGANNTKRKATSHLVSFAAGIILAAAFLNILPEAFEQGTLQRVLEVTLLGMVIAFFMERFVLWYHHHHEETHNIHPSFVLVLLGDALHNFIDGVAIAATFVAFPALGVTTTIAIAAHEIPQELADFTVLVNAGLEKSRAILYNFLSALTAVIGGVAGFYFLSRFENLLPLVLGFSAGIFIYIASADLIPELHAEYKKKRSFAQAIPFVIGIILMLLLTKYFAHAAHNDDQDIFGSPRTVQKVHWHAGFQVYQEDKLLDFSDLRFMHIEPCGDRHEEKHNEEEEEQIEKAHLHDNVGDVIHVHRSDALWRDLFVNLDLDMGGTIQGFVNGKEVPDLLDTPITPYSSVVFFIGKNTQTDKKLKDSVRKDKIDEIEKKSETC